MNNTRNNPAKKSFTLNELRGKWLSNKYRQEDEMRAMREMRRIAGEFHGKDLTDVVINRGKKVFIKTSTGFKQLSLSNA